MVLEIRKAVKISISLASLAALAAIPVEAADGEKIVTPFGNKVLEQIIVTARKREDNLQEIPVSVQAFSASDISRLGIANFSDVAEYSPSIIFDLGADPTTTRIAIRGLHPTRGRQNVAILVDGIDVGTEAIGGAGGGAILNSRITDIERIEVVRGPQSALFGRSAFAGAIQYVTKDPSEEAESNVSVSIGNHGRYDVGGSLSGPVPGNYRDRLGFRLNANYWSEEGFYEDTATGTPLGGSEGGGLALTAKWIASEALSFKARAEYTHAEYDQQADYLVRANTGKLSYANDPLLMAIEAEDPSILASSGVALFKGKIPDGDDLGSPVRSPDPLTGGVFPGTDRDVFRVSLIGNWDIGVGTITSYTSLTDVEGGTRQDSDGDADLDGSIDISRRGSILEFDSSINQFSQELRFASSWDSPFQASFGGLYWTERSKRLARTTSFNCSQSLTTSTDVCNDLVGGVTESSAELARQTDPNIVPYTSSRDVDHWSIYALLEWELNDQFKLTAEARYNDEEEDVVGLNCDLERVPGCFDPVNPITAFSRTMHGPSSTVRGLQNAAVYGVPAKAITSSDWWTPRLTAEWAPREDMLFYATASKGQKPAGTTLLLAGAWFDVDHDGSLDERRFEAEEMWSYELGGKVIWTDTLRTNVAVFFQDYKNKQVMTSLVGPAGTAIPIIENAGAAEVWGVELESWWQPIESLGFGLSYTYLDTEYTNFLAITDSKTRIIRGGNCTITTLSDGSTSCQVDLSGNKLEKAPENALVAQVAYQAPVPSAGNAALLVEADVIYQSERFGAQENYRTLDEYTVANLRFGLAADTWKVLFYINNLLDDDTVKRATTKTGSVDRTHPQYDSNPNKVRSSTNAVSADLPDPRTYGIRVSFDF
ncbi:MAG: TonB-dependent receptor [Pseudomonadota bacterium]|nr:TonB-dependent receptor [Pseudomonadota bacterium]